MSKKWYEYFVSVDQGGAAAGDGPASKAPASDIGPRRTPSQTVADIAATVAPEPKFTAPVNNPSSFDEIYRAAEIQVPAHGYTIYKVADMLQNEHIRNLPVDVKRNSVLVALEAAGVKIEEVVQDAVRRDRALDTYERVQRRALEQLEAQKSKENADIQGDIDRYVAQQRARIQANNDAIEKEKQRLYAWRLNKQQEEQKISDAVGYFLTENPITTSNNPGAPRTAPAKSATDGKS